MISITTVHIHTQKLRQTLLFRYEPLLTSDLGSSTQGEKIFKSFVSYCANKTPNCLVQCQPSNSRLHGRDKNCLSAWSTIKSKLTLFQNLQILGTIASGYDVIHTPAPFPIWNLFWQLWLSYPLCASVTCTQCLCTWTKSWIVQSPTKQNDKM